MSARSKVLLWDLDGVLWDSSEAHFTAYNLALAPHQIRINEYKNISGRKTLEVVSELFYGKNGAAESIVEVVNQKQAYAKSILASRPPIMDGCVSIIQDLSKTFKQALVSSASIGTVNIFLEATGLRKYFDVILSGDDCSSAKPSPQLFLMALDKLNMTVKDAIVIEDSESGIMAAEIAGIPVIAFRHSSGEVKSKIILSHAQNLQEIYDYVIKDC